MLVKREVEVGVGHGRTLDEGEFVDDAVKGGHG
jgi:hypothetical protein